MPTVKGDLFVFSAFSNVPATATQTRCDWAVDKFCSTAYTRRILGIVATDAMLADTEAELQKVWAWASNHQNILSMAMR